MSKQLKARIILPLLLPASYPSNDRLIGKCSLNYRRGTTQVRNRIGQSRFFKRRLKSQSSNMIVENKCLSTRPQTAISDNLPARDLLKPRNPNLVVSTGSKKVTINTRLIDEPQNRAKHAHTTASGGPTGAQSNCIMKRNPQTRIISD